MVCGLDHSGSQPFNYCCAPHSYYYDDFTISQDTEHDFYDASL